MSDGFEKNAAFFTFTYEASLSVRHNRAFARIAAMLWMRGRSEGRIISDLGERDGRWRRPMACWQTWITPRRF